MKFVSLDQGGGSYHKFEENWRSQCEEYGEDFDSYAEGSRRVLSDVAALNGSEKNNGVFALVGDGLDHHAVCMVNTTPLKGYAGKVMRVRHLLAAPRYDFGPYDPMVYGKMLTKVFWRLYELSERGSFKAKHLKLHLRSPADSMFFANLGTNLADTKEFDKVEMLGAWLYVTK